VIGNEPKIQVRRVLEVGVFHLVTFPLEGEVEVKLEAIS
jgi:hypothetical protein